MRAALQLRHDHPGTSPWWGPAMSLYTKCWCTATRQLVRAQVTPVTRARRLRGRSFGKDLERRGTGEVQLQPPASLKWHTLCHLYFNIFYNRHDDAEWYGASVLT